MKSYLLSPKASLNCSVCTASSQRRRCHSHQPCGDGGSFSHCLSLVSHAGSPCFVVPPTRGPLAYFLLVTVDILPMFSCGIMIKPDSILLSLCCIISMGQYFWYYQCNLEYLQGVCVCFCSAWWDSMFKAGWREPRCCGSPTSI